MKIRKILKEMAIYGTIVIFLVWCSFPLLYIGLSSFKTRLECVTIPPVWIFKPTLENYRAVILERGFPHFLTNSFIVAIISTIFSLLIALPAAYSFSRFRFRGKRWILIWILGTQMLPALGLTIPLFIIYNTLHLIDTVLVLIITYLIFNVPYGTFMLKGFLEGISPSAEESAMIDGCSRLEAFYRVTLPLALPGLVATAVFLFIGSWNEFAFALFFTSRNARTAPTMAVQFLTHLGVRWGEMFAYASLTVLPVVIFSILVQRYLISALTFGTVAKEEET